MSNFNFNKYLKNNPLLKETSGYGNYTQPKTMLEDDDDYDYQSAEDFDLNPQDGENDPLGPDEELMEGAGGFLTSYYSRSEPTVKHVAQEIDGILSTLNIPDVNLEQLTDLIIALGDAYAEERVENYRAETLY